MAPPRTADLARPTQQRDDCRRAAANARLAAETGIYLGGAAASQLDHALADPADGRDHRDFRDLGVVSQAQGDGDQPRRRYRWLRAPPDRAAAFAASGLPGRHAIGCFGRVRAQKGSDLFVEAMCRLLPRYPDFTAVLVGAITPEQTMFANELKRRIEAAGLTSRIVMTGEIAIEEVRRWYQRLTIYVFASRNEGFGLTLIEAMASGAALVAVAGRGCRTRRGERRQRRADAAR